MKNYDVGLRKIFFLFFIFKLLIFNFCPSFADETEKMIAVVKKMVENKDYPAFVKFQRIHQKTNLLELKDIEFSEAFISNVLMEAIVEKNFEMAKKVLPYVKDINYVNSYGYSPLIMATTVSHDELCLEIIKKGATKNLVSKVQKLSAIYLATMKNKTSLAKILFDNINDLNFYYDTNDETLLNLAIKNNNIDLVNFYLSQGANVNLPNGEGEYPLEIALKNGLHDIARKLLEKGANPNQLDNESLAPIEFIKNINPKMVIDLMKYGANPFLDNETICNLVDQLADKKYYPMVNYLLNETRKYFPFKEIKPYRMSEIDEVEQMQLELATSDEFGLKFYSSKFTPDQIKELIKSKVDLLDLFYNQIQLLTRSYDKNLSFEELLKISQNDIEIAEYYNLTFLGQGRVNIDDIILLKKTNFDLNSFHNLIEFNYLDKDNEKKFLKTEEIIKLKRKGVSVEFLKKYISIMKQFKDHEDLNFYDELYTFLKSGNLDLAYLNDITKLDYKKVKELLKKGTNIFFIQNLNLHKINPDEILKFIQLAENHDKKSLNPNHLNMILEIWRQNTSKFYNADQLFPIYLSTMKAKLDEYDMEMKKLLEKKKNQTKSSSSSSSPSSTSSTAEETQKLPWMNDLKDIIRMTNLLNFHDEDDSILFKLYMNQYYCDKGNNHDVDQKLYRSIYRVFREHPTLVKQQPPSVLIPLRQARGDTTHKNEVGELESNYQNFLKDLEQIKSHVLSADKDGKKYWMGLIAEEKNKKEVYDKIFDKDFMLALRKKNITAQELAQVLLNKIISIDSSLKKDELNNDYKKIMSQLFKVHQLILAAEEYKKSNPKKKDQLYFTKLAKTYKDYLSDQSKLGETLNAMKWTNNVRQQELTQLDDLSSKQLSSSPRILTSSDELENSKKLILRPLSLTESTFRGCLGGTDCSSRTYPLKALQENIVYFTLEDEQEKSNGQITVFLGTLSSESDQPAVFIDKIMNIPDQYLEDALAAIQFSLQAHFKNDRIPIIIPKDLGLRGIGITNDTNTLLKLENVIKKYLVLPHQQKESKFQVVPSQFQFSNDLSTFYSRAENESLPTQQLSFHGHHQKLSLIEQTGWSSSFDDYKKSLENLRSKNPKDIYKELKSFLDGQDEEQIKFIKMATYLIKYGGLKNKMQDYIDEIEDLLNNPPVFGKLTSKI